VHPHQHRAGGPWPGVSLPPNPPTWLAAIRVSVAIKGPIGLEGAEGQLGIWAFGVATEPNRSVPGRVG